MTNIPRVNLTQISFTSLGRFCLLELMKGLFQECSKLDMLENIGKFIISF